MKAAAPRNKTPQAATPHVSSVSPASHVSPNFIKPRTNAADRFKSRKGKPKSLAINARAATIERENLFVRRYLVDLNVTRSVLECGGYNCRTEASAANFGQQLLKRPRVALMVKEAMAARAKKFDLQADDVLNELKHLGKSNMLDYARITPDGGAVVDLTNTTRDQAAAVQEITSEVYTDGARIDADGDSEPVTVKRTRLKLYDKRGPLELLGKHMGLFMDPPVPPSKLNMKIRVVYEDQQTGQRGGISVEAANV